MAADIITILTCFGPTLQFVVVNVIPTLRSHLFITDAKSLYSLFFLLPSVLV